MLARLSRITARLRSVPLVSIGWRIERKVSSFASLSSKSLVALSTPSITSFTVDDISIAFLKEALMVGVLFGLKVIRGLTRPAFTSFGERVGTYIGRPPRDRRLSTVWSMSFRMMTFSFGVISATKGAW